MRNQVTEVAVSSMQWKEQGLLKISKSRLKFHTVMEPENSSPFHTFRLILSILLSLILCTSCQSVKIQRSLEEELERYPESNLRDIYKSWFQSVYGPGHLLTDSIAAIQYLSAELEQTRHYKDTTYWYPLGIDGRFGRLNLYVAASGKVPKEEFFNAFTESAGDFTLPEITDWHKKWSRIQSVMEKHGLKPGNYENDRRMIDSMLLNNEYVIHHSDKFIQFYDPHYRVISTAAYKKLKKRYSIGK